jgi:SAM-dependent methyltransferase
MTAQLALAINETMASNMTNVGEQLPNRTLKDAGIYLLNDGDMAVETRRLDIQHSILLRVTQGALLPPHVLHHLTDVIAANAAEDRSKPRPAAVADVATGTGVWLRDLAKLLPPDARLDGFDHDSSKFPPSAPPMNLQLHKQDIFDSFPKECRGIYDIVHVRLLAYVLRADQWQDLIEHLISELLRPGGWLVWEEPVVHATMGVPLTPYWAKRQQLLGLLEKADGRDPM